MFNVKGLVQNPTVATFFFRKIYQQHHILVLNRMRPYLTCLVQLKFGEENPPPPPPTHLSCVLPSLISVVTVIAPHH